MSNTVRHIKVAEDDHDQRLDRWLKKILPDIPYGLAQKLIRQGQLRVDGKRAKPDTRLRAGQDVRIPPVTGAAQGPRKISPQDAAFIHSLVIYDDGDVMAINKPQGLATQGGTNIKKSVDALLDALKDKKGVRPRLVHRLDRDTSGILLLARSAEAARRLGDIFKGRHIKKIYWALVAPTPQIPSGTIRGAIRKGAQDRMEINEESGKPATTEYTVIESTGEGAAFVAFWPRTGRTHQIRVHAQWIGSPILGDEKYGEDREDLDGMEKSQRLHLHARRIILPHPSRKGVLDITAPLPPDLAKSWKSFGFDPSGKNDPFEHMEL